MDGRWAIWVVGAAACASLSCKPHGNPQAEREARPPASLSSHADTPAGAHARPTVSSVAASQPTAPAAASASASAEPEEDPPVRHPLAVRRDRDTSGRQRMEAAERDKRDLVTGLFEKVGLGFPPRQLLLRAFKKESRVEVWAADQASGPLTHVTSYAICYASGELGPKRREGDGQVPEGFYVLSWYKAKSDYHLAMQVSYPNRSDRVLGHPTEPGGEIMIHGSCVSIGCLAMSDDRIEELWVIAHAAPRPVPVHIFPSRDMQGLLDSQIQPQHEAFWRNLKTGFDRFEQTHELLGVRSARDGRYLFD